MTNELNSNERRRIVIQLLNWSEEDIRKLDEINVNWMILEDGE